MVRFVISRNLDGAGHHLFLLRRFRHHFDRQRAFELLTPASNQPVVDKQFVQSDHIVPMFFGASTFRFFLGILASPQRLLGQDNNEDVSIVHDDVNWKDLLFYLLLTARLISTGKKKQLSRVTVVFRYTFQEPLRRVFYGTSLRLLNSAGCLVTSDSRDILAFWGLLKNDNQEEAPVPVNDVGLFPIIPSLLDLNPGKTGLFSDPPVDWAPRVGIPGKLRADKGLYDVLKLTDGDLAGIDLCVNLPEEHSAQRDRFSEFGSFVDDAGYAQAISRLDFQLFWFNIERYRHATSSTFFEAILLGVVPLARRGTFCATILERSGLDELVFDDIADTFEFARQKNSLAIANTERFGQLCLALQEKFSTKNIGLTSRSVLR